MQCQALSGRVDDEKNMFNNIKNNSKLSEFLFLLCTITIKNYIIMKRIYHPYWKWEDYKAGFYDNCSGERKAQLINKCIQMFNNEQLTIKYMNLVIENWVYSCQHNLTNESLNKIAYIGQAACCLYGGVPSTVTMEAWSMLDAKVQERANKEAEKVLNKWILDNKRIQLCLNLD